MRRSRVLVGLIIFVVMFSLVSETYGSDIGGSVNDPLVTKSYVDELFISISEKLSGDNYSSSFQNNTSNEELKVRLEKVENKIDKVVNELPDDISRKIEGKGDFINAEVYVVVEVRKDQKIVLGSGAEVILRAGEADIIVGKNGDGLADVTVGKDLKKGDKIPRQHLLISSRNDGRALKVTSNGTAYLLVKGDYKVE